MGCPSYPSQVLAILNLQRVPWLCIMNLKKILNFMLHFRLLRIMFYWFQLDLFYFLGLVSNNECMYRNVLIRPRILLATMFIVRFHNRNAKTDIMMLWKLTEWLCVYWPVLARPLNAFVILIFSCVSFFLDVSFAGY